MNENVNEKKAIFTVKNIMKVLSVLCIVFVFCPSFLVSCSGQTLKISAIKAVGGISMYGDKVVKPYPIMLLCLLIPVAILVLLFIKKISGNILGVIVLACSAADFIIWLIFRATAKNMAEESYCTFKTTAWYVINLIVQILLILLSVLIVIKKMEMDTDLIAIFTKGSVPKTVNETKEAPIGYCTECGSPITYGKKFCISCGTAVPEDMIAEAEAAKKAVEETKTCQQCGAKLQEGAAFCVSCGAKVE